MIISTIKEELETAGRPVAKALQKGAGNRAISIGFKEKMKLEEHTAHLPTTLLVLEGCIRYTEGEKELTLAAMEESVIPVDVPHEVVALEDSLILLVQG